MKRAYSTEQNCKSVQGNGEDDVISMLRNVVSHSRNGTRRYRSLSRLFVMPLSNVREPSVAQVSQHENRELRCL